MHARIVAMKQTSHVQLRYAVRAPDEAWVLPEGPVPESISHTLTLQHLFLVLEFWASRAGRPLFVARNLAVRWLEERPSVGIDPDLCLLDPPPPDLLDVRSLCLWKPGHLPPQLCFEVVSESHPYKDYVGVQERYAVFGARELVVFDPLLAGPRSLGGPVLLQIWRRDELGVFERCYAGSGPAFCDTLGAWLLPTDRLLRIADDLRGERCWPTAEEHERTEKERALAERERERAEKEQERAEKERERAEKEQERAEKERERAARLDVERRLAALERAGGH
jgi:Uma2 family endonuclease